MPTCIQVVSSSESALVGEHQTPVARYMFLVQIYKLMNIQISNIKYQISNIKYQISNTDRHQTHVARFI